MTPTPVPLAEHTAKWSRRILPWIVGFAVLCCVFLGGYSIGASQTEQSYALGKAAGWEAARLKVADSGLMPTASTQTMRGLVSAVGPDWLEMAVDQTVVNPLEQPAPLTRRVTIGPDTKILLTQVLSAAEMEAEMARFRREMDEYATAAAAGQRPEVPSEPKREREAKGTVSDLKEGMSVVVTAAEDIATAASFNATEIRASGASQPTTPPPGE